MKITVVIVIVAVLIVLGLGVYLLSSNPTGMAVSAGNQQQPTDSTINSSNTPSSNPPSSGSNSGSGTTLTGMKYDVSIMNFAFSPQTLTIVQGGTVIWTNSDSAAHTVVSDSGSEIMSGSLSQGQTYAHTFNTPGTYTYYCSVHPNMRGTIIVQPASSSSTPSTQTTTNTGSSGGGSSGGSGY